MTKKLEEGDIVLCTVNKIIGTIVFVEIEGQGEGNISFSEIAPGRIRNIRDYVVPKKKIICKVLRISPNGNIDLSFRRVTPKEQKEMKEKNKQEKGYKSILKTVLGEKVKDLISQVTKEETIYDFLEEAKEDPKRLEKIVGKSNSIKILEILNTQKSKKSIVKKEFNIHTNKSNGLELIKTLFSKIKPVQAKYISAGKYSLELEGENLKSADQELKKIISEIEKTAKNAGFELSIIEK